MTVLVTGGVGYVGSHTVRALRDVVALESLELGQADAVIYAPSLLATSPTATSSPR